MKIGRLEIAMTPSVIILGALGLLWFAVSFDVFRIIAAYREVNAWRRVCDRDGGVFVMDERQMSCTFPNGSKASMIWRQPDL